MNTLSPPSKDQSARRKAPLGRVSVITVTIVVCLILLVFVRMALRSSFHSPADVIRPHVHEYNRTLITPPTTEIKPVPPPTQFLVTTNGNIIRIEYAQPQQHYLDLLGGVTFHPVKAGEPVQAGDVSVRLKRIGFAAVTNAYQHGTQPGSQIPAVFFTPELDKYEQETLLAELPDPADRQLFSMPNWPVFGFDFEMKGGPWRVLSLKLFDTRTHESLSPPWGYALPGGDYRVFAVPSMWHEGPVTLVLDLAVGPMTYEEVAIAPAATFKLGDLQGQLIFIGDWVDTQPHGQGFGGMTNYVEFITSPSNRESFLLYHLRSRVESMAYEIQHLEATGGVRPLMPEGWMGELQTIKFNGRIKQGDRLRISKYDKRHRLVIQLPKLPGLPAENQKVENLFAVRVPYLFFPDEDSHQHFIGTMTQLEFHSLKSYNPPPGTYPRAFTNASLAEVLRDYAEMNSLGGIYVDPEAFSIEQDNWELYSTLKELRRLIRFP